MTDNKALDVERKMYEIIESKVPHAKGKIALDKTFNDLEVDSLDQTEVMMSVEDHFSIAFEDKEMESFTTLQHLLDGIKDKLALRDSDGGK